jgi:hypothetical protein
LSRSFSHADKARHALRVYAERGEEAVMTLAKDGADAFFAALTRREHAFHNFKIWDARARSGGVDMAEEPSTAPLVSQIIDTNARLGVMMGEALTRLGEQLSRMRHARVCTRSYLSGRHQPVRLIKTA